VIPETTRQLWLRQISRSARAAKSVRRNLILLLAVPAALALLAGNLQTAAQSFMELALLLVLMRSATRPQAWRAAREMPETGEPFVGIRSDLLAFARVMEINPALVTPRIDPSDLGLCPSIRSMDGPSPGAKRASYLHIPLGFLRLYLTDREASRAILAHEVAHVKQDDWRLWALASSYLAVLKSVFFPLMVVNLLFLAVLAFDAGATQLRSHVIADNARDYVEVMEEYHRSKDRLTAALGGGGDPFGWSSSRSIVDMVAGQVEDPEETLAKIRSFVTQAIFLMVLLLVAIALRLSGLRYLTSRRARSELLADQGAALVTSPASLARALRELGGHSRGPGWFAEHPPIHVRLRAVGEPVTSRARRARPPIPVQMRTGSRMFWDWLRAQWDGRALHQALGLSGVRPGNRRLAYFTAAVLLVPAIFEVGSAVFEAANAALEFLVVQNDPLRAMDPDGYRAAYDASDTAMAGINALPATLPRRLLSGALEAIPLALALRFVRRDLAAVFLAAIATAVGHVLVTKLSYPDIGLNTPAAVLAGIVAAFVGTGALYGAIAVALNANLAAYRAIAYGTVFSLGVQVANSMIGARHLLGESFYPLTPWFAEVVPYNLVFAVVVSLAIVIGLRTARQSPTA